MSSCLLFWPIGWLVELRRTQNRRESLPQTSVAENPWLHGNGAAEPHSRHQTENRSAQNRILVLAALPNCVAVAKYKLLIQSSGIPQIPKSGSSRTDLGRGSLCQQRRSRLPFVMQRALATEATRSDSTELNLNPTEEARRRSLETDGSDLFRGVAPGERVGPYLSQFLLLGNSDVGNARSPLDGFVQFGAIGIQQKVRIADEYKDYMTVWNAYVDVQNGADVRGAETYLKPEEDGRNVCDTDKGHRFITTPRDLATYVHYDALYEAYLNACLFLLASGAPLDRGIPFQETDTFDKQQGFAHFGGPHILTLVCEVATRALKAVRYQKFNIHRRLRPEAVGGLIDAWINVRADQDGALAPLAWLMDGDTNSDGFNDLQWSTGISFVDRIKAHNEANNLSHHQGELPRTRGRAKIGEPSYLLPMAFPEGSPMHPAYGAGHATVAGACVTILKAYFDHGWTPPSWFDDPSGSRTPIAYEPNSDGSTLVPIELNAPLTVEGELNKLAGNIAIGRNWAGVHYYTDYIESIRMGEQIAIGLLEEQKLTYPENFTMTVPLFDRGAVRI